MRPLSTRTFDAATLMREHPPRWFHENKRLVATLGEAAGPFSGEMVYTRWEGARPPEELGPPRSLEVREGLFAYAPDPDPKKVVWHLNFADPVLFGAYPTALLAQDELQVMEHPALGALVEALNDGREPGTTVDPRTGDPTPVTVTGVQRRVAFDTRPSARSPRGLYGNRFAEASAAAVKLATTPLRPPTISNLLAIAAPACGSGRYQRGQVERILNTAWSGFRATALESRRLGGRAEVHTGFWGCGAFGGDRTIMTLLQALAARLAGVDLVFWAFDEAGVTLAQEAFERFEAMAGPSTTTALVGEILAMHRSWGVSDGN